MIARWETRGRAAGNRRRTVMIDALADELGNLLVDERGNAFDSTSPADKALSDERGLVLVDENDRALLAL
jgi:hypothetical protein